jgi:hypothetical protein
LGRQRAIDDGGDPASLAPTGGHSMIRPLRRSAIKHPVFACNRAAHQASAPNGWSQKAERTSDAYATNHTPRVRSVAGYPVEQPETQRAIDSMVAT